MPLRMFYHIVGSVPPSFSSLIEGIILTSLAIWKGTLAFISEDHWDKLTGPHGLVFALVVGIIIMWSKSVRDDAARERRHKETLKSQEDHFKQLIDLNAKASSDLKILTVASTKAQMSATNAIISMDHNIIRLTSELSDQARISVKRKALRTARREQEERESAADYTE